MADFEKKQPVLDRRHFVGGALAASALAALAGCTKGGTTTGGSAATGGAQGGTLRASNNPDGGARFEIAFPKLVV